LVDPTQWDEAEFTTPGNQGEQGRMDLLSALMHEMDPVLGCEHDAEGVMQESLPPGTRRVPTGEEDGTAAMPDHPLAEGFPNAPRGAGELDLAALPLPRGMNNPG
jgi:hypothetical protein